MNPNTYTVSHLSDILLDSIEKIKSFDSDENISVNPVVAEVATWYEKLRNAMAYKEDEVILRAAIERILNRRLILGAGSGETLARPLIRELAWARYFPDLSIPEALVHQVEHSIDLHLELQRRVISRHSFNGSLAYEWILELLSSDIENILNLRKEKDLLANFMFQIFKDKVFIEDDSEETRDAQVYIAVRRSFCKEDLAFLRFHLFIQFFGKLSSQNLDQVSEYFPKITKKIDFQLKYKLKDRVFSYIRNQTAPFFILEDLIKKYKADLRSLTLDQDSFDAAVMSACSNRYKDILTKVQRAIVRSVIFIFVTKVVFALAAESSFESLIYGSVSWFAIAINTLMSPLLMIIVSIFIKTPDKDNSKKILEMVHEILFSANPNLNRRLVLSVNPKQSRPLLPAIFSMLWLVALLLGIWGINSGLNLMHFNLVSKCLFIFFLMIVSFLSYRINQTAKIYTVKVEKESFWSVLFDFLFMPFIQMGRTFTLGMSKINIFLFIFDFIIETPFKGIFAFFEHWFLYLRTQRESLD